MDEAVAGGAKVLAGGKPLPEIGGHFYPPTVLVDVNHGMRIMQDEVREFIPPPDAQCWAKVVKCEQVAEQSTHHMGGFWSRIVVYDARSYKPYATLQS